MPNYLGTLSRVAEHTSIVDLVNAGNTMVLVVGHIGKEPEMRYSPQGKEIAKFPVAVSWGKRGEPNQQTEWVACTAWEREAKIMRRFSKGDAICLIGKVTRRLHDGKEYGDFTVWSLAVPVWKVEEERSPDPIKSAQPPNDDDIPF